MRFDLQTAQLLDKQDKLNGFKDCFFTPRRSEDECKIYLCGNSLGLQYSGVDEAIEKQLDVWRRYGVEGWFKPKSPWLNYHQNCQKLLTDIVGAKAEEVCPMNSLTVNLHFLMTSFYQPTAQKYKILTIASDFPSDQYALETHLKSRGIDPKTAIVEVAPRPNEHMIHTEDILKTIEDNAEELALVFISGVHYYTGQYFDLEAITKKAKEKNILIGLDLAHAVGNVPLKLHDWQVDFAIWCSYKYLNAGPGAIAGIFVHQNHHDSDLPRLAGWWGYDEATRFEMKSGFVPMVGAAGWQVSTPNILALAALEYSLRVFEEAGGMAVIREKSLLLTRFLELVILETNQHLGYDWIEIMTPKNPEERGCQLSLLVKSKGKELFDFLTKNDIIGDWREPNCIRLSPVPLYNSFEQIWEVGQVLKAFGV